MAETSAENPQTVQALFNEVDSIIPRANQAYLFWPTSFDKVRDSDRDIDEIGESDHSLREFYSAELYMAADRIRRRVELNCLPKEWRTAADNLEALIQEKLGVTRSMVSDMIYITNDIILLSVPAPN